MTDNPETDAARLIAAYELDENPPTRQLTSLCSMAARLYGAVHAEVVVEGRTEPVAEYGGTRPSNSPCLSVPLVAPDGTEFARLSVRFDTEPAESETETLSDLSERMVDVLELELVSREAFELTEQLAACEQRRHDFVRKVVHDLNNPLAAIAMSAELAHDQLGEGDNPIVIAMIDKASRGAERLKAMVDALDKHGMLDED